MSDALLNRDGIEALIPHREPFIFVDRIVELGVRPASGRGHE